MEKKKLFITGINGTIGGILQAGLAGMYDIFGLDIVGPFSDRVFEANIDDYEGVLGVLREAGPFPSLIHMAADPRVKAPWESVLPNNIMGTRNVFEAARHVGVRRVIFASSSHVTGAYDGIEPDTYLHHQPDPRRIQVSDPIRPDSDYGVSKAFGEALARYYTSRWAISSICLRIGVVLRDDRPVGHPWFKKGWLSHRDLVQLVTKSLQSNIVFGIYYGMSNNTGGFWDITNARLELGYEPQDDAADYWQDITRNQ
jgi:NAD+ dependent glucose-6-phosphate dehydrogenase